MKWMVAATLFAAALCVAGCSESKSVGCAKNDECPASHVCQGAKCEKICDADIECPNGMYCNGTICVEGTRAAPEIASVSGNSAQSCTPVGGTPGACLGTGLVVQGQNLGGSTFVLDAVEAGLSDVTLQTGARVEATLVDLIPTSTVAAGTYTLVATNSAGKDEATVTLLEGEQGDQGPAGPSGPSGPSGPAGSGGGGGGSGATKWVYRNTNATDDSAALESNTSVGNRYVLEVTAANGSTVSQKIDDTKLLSLCSDIDGCTVTIGMTGWEDWDASGLPIRTMKALYAGPPCRFAITAADRNWATSPHCYATYAQIASSFVAANWDANQSITYAEWNSTKTLAHSDPNKKVADNPQLLRYRPLGSARSGVDGSNDGGASTVLNFLSGCLFGEAPDGGLDEDNYPVYQNDNSAGFYFIAAGSDWTTLPWQWDAISGRSCVLIIED